MRQSRRAKGRAGVGICGGVCEAVTCGALFWYFHGSNGSPAKVRVWCQMCCAGVASGTRDGRVARSSPPTA